MLRSLYSTLWIPALVTYEDSNANSLNRRINICSTSVAHILHYLSVNSLYPMNITTKPDKKIAKLDKKNKA